MPFGENRGGHRGRESPESAARFQPRVAEERVQGSHVERDQEGVGQAQRGERIPEVIGKHERRGDHSGLPAGEFGRPKKEQPEGERGEDRAGKPESEPRDAKNPRGKRRPPNQERGFIEGISPHEMRCEPAPIARHRDCRVRVEGLVLGRDLADGVDVVACQADAGRANQQAGQRQQGNGAEGPSHTVKTITRWDRPSPCVACQPSPKPQVDRRRKTIACPTFTSTSRRFPDR